MALSNQEFEELEGLLSPTGKLGRKMQEKLGLKQEKGLTLLVVDAGEVNPARLELARILGRKKKPGIYLSGSIPASALEEQLAKSNIETKRIVFVDFATRRTSVSQKENCFYTGGPKEITGLVIALQKAMEKIPEEKQAFLAFDSVSVLLAYHKKQIVERFVHRLSAKVRARQKMQAVLILIKEDTNKALLSRISQYCDKTVHL